MQERPVKILRIVLQGLSNVTLVAAMLVLMWGLLVVVLAATEASGNGAVLASAVLIEGLAAAVVAFRLASAAQRLEPPGPPRCAVCGYDLRFLVSGRCPECGRPVPRVRAA